MKQITLIGAGLIGQERIKAVRKLQERGHSLRLTGVFDPFQPKMAELASGYDFVPFPDLEAALIQPADLVIVACPHDIAAEIAGQALHKGHRVLLEKPLGRDEHESRQITAAAKDENQLILGLNYRFMPGVAALACDLRECRFGQPIALSIKLGHGGRPGDEKGWKLDPIRCGGGALLDPGIHVLDLARYLLGTELGIQHVSAWAGFWKTGIEEHVTVASNHLGTAVTLDVSIVRWRSEFEIFLLGTEGYGVVYGRGRSYGRQTYRRGKRWGWQHATSQAASEEIVVDDPCEDSFADELAKILGFAGGSAPATLVLRTESQELMAFYQRIKNLLPLQPAQSSGHA